MGKKDPKVCIDCGGPCAYRSTRCKPCAIAQERKRITANVDAGKVRRMLYKRGEL